MFYHIKRLLINCLVVICFIWILLLPSTAFYLGLDNSLIFPLFAIMIIYYLFTYDGMNMFYIFIVGGFNDQLNDLSLGTSILSLYLSCLLLGAIKSLIIKNNQSFLVRYILFCIYTLFVLSIICVINYFNCLGQIDCQLLLLEYIITTLSYPIFQMILDNIAHYACKKKST